MPAYNFQKRFVPKIEDGSKRLTIRAKRWKNPKPGDPLYLYVGQRTKSCRKISDEVCMAVDDIVITDAGVLVNFKWLNHWQCEDLARRDGFESYMQFREFYTRYHDLPFDGVIIHW